MLLTWRCFEQHYKQTGYISQTVKLGALGIPAYRSFSLVELEAATDNFQVSSLMGQDAHGQVCALNSQLSVFFDIHLNS